MALIKRNKLSGAAASPSFFEEQVVNVATPKTSSLQFHSVVEQPADIEIKAKDLIQARADELMSQANLEIEFKLKQARLDAQSIIDSAKSQSETVLHSAHQEAEARRIEIQAALEHLELEKSKLGKLIEQEKHKAFNEAMMKADLYIAELMQILGTFQNAKRNMLVEVKEEIVALALDVAKQILAYEVDHNPELLEQQVYKSISKVINSKGVIQIYLNPEDIRHADYLENLMSKILDPSVRLAFLKDEAVNKGSCRVNTQGGHLDASFNGQIELIKVAFEKYLGHKISDIKTIEEDEMLTLIKPEIQSINSLGHNFEPSDDDLAMIESELASSVSLDVDPETEALLQELLATEGDTQEGPDFAKTDDDLALRNLEVSAKARPKDEEDEDFDFEEDDIEEDEDSEENDDLDDFDDEDLEEFDEFEGDSDDDSDSADERFPEY